MREFAESFYKSKQWQKCRAAYVRAAAGLCERCLRKGLVVPGEIVHHKVHINERNINNPTITLNWENLELLCRNCHGEMHQVNRRRFTIGEGGKVISKDDPPH